MTDPMQIYDLSGKTALITGGSRGTGQAIARRFLQAGASVILVARRAEVLHATRMEFEEIARGRTQAYGYDLANRDETARHCDWLRQKDASIDILVDNAGSSTRMPFESLTDEIWRKDFDVKVLASLQACGPATRHLVAMTVLRALGPSGIIFGIARGTVIDEEALITASSDGTIAGAGLDVAEQQPRLPEDLRGWTMSCSRRMGAEERSKPIEEASFYLGASMSRSTMFAFGLALAVPQVAILAFMDDGAFCMNSGALMVERKMNLPNLWHILVSNRCYGNTGNTPLPISDRNDYATITRGVGVERIFTFDSMDGLVQGFEEAFSRPSGHHTVIVLEADPMTPDELKLGGPPFDGPELKYRFGRHVEKVSGRNVFGYRLDRRASSDAPPRGNLRLWSRRANPAYVLPEASLRLDELCDFRAGA